MKKSIIILLVIAISLSLVGVASAAAPAPGGPFNTAFYVQNLEGAEAQCSYVFYDSAGAAKLTSAAFAVPANGSVQVFTGGMTDVAAGQYSAVVSCNKKAAAMANYSDMASPSQSGFSGASYGGVSAPATTWYAPAIYDNYYKYYSNIYVQNATGSSVKVTVEFYGDTGGGTIGKVAELTSPDVAAYASYVFDQSGMAQLADNKPYSAKITATGNVAPVVNIYGGPTDSGGNPIQLYSYNPFSSGGTKFYAPILYNDYYGYNTSLAVQNIDSADATVKITYSNGATKEFTLTPSGGKELLTFAADSGVPADRTHFYSAVVESTNGKNIVVTVNESGKGIGAAATYVGLGGGSTSVSIPLIMKNFYTYYTDVTCQNLGNVAADITITYAGPVTGSTTKSAVAAGATANFLTKDDPNFASVTEMKTAGSATATSTQPIACVINEGLNGAPPANVDALFSFNGFAINP